MTPTPALQSRATDAEHKNPWNCPEIQKSTKSPTKKIREDTKNTKRVVHKWPCLHICGFFLFSWRILIVFFHFFVFSGELVWNPPRHTRHKIWFMLLSLYMGGWGSWHISDFRAIPDFCALSSASGDSLHGGASLQVDPKNAHFAAWKKGPENRKHEVKLRPPLCSPLSGWSTLWVLCTRQSGSASLLHLHYHPDCPVQTPNGVFLPKWPKKFDPFLGQFSQFSVILPPFSRWGQNPFFGHCFPISGRRPDLGSVQGNRGHSCVCTCFGQEAFDMQSACENLQAGAAPKGLHCSIAAQLSQHAIAASGKQAAVGVHTALPTSSEVFVLSQAQKKGWYVTWYLWRSLKTIQRAAKKGGYANYRGYATHFLFRSLFGNLVLVFGRFLVIFFSVFGYFFPNPFRLPPFAAQWNNSDHSHPPSCISKIANRQSPIARVQRARSTLASHRNSTWNECYTNECQSRDPNRGTTNAGSMRTSIVFWGEDMTANER